MAHIMSNVDLKRALLFIQRWAIGPVGLKKWCERQKNPLVEQKGLKEICAPYDSTEVLEAFRRKYPDIYKLGDKK